MTAQFEHVVDSFGNEMAFGNTGGVRVAALPHVTDYATLLDRIRDVTLRPDDVIVVGYPKSGNNWTHHLAAMLVAGSTQLPCLFTPEGFVFLEGAHGAMALPPPDRPRVLLTHLPFRCLPRDVLDKKVKIVYVTRNPKDVLVSLWCHVSSVRPPIGYTGAWPHFFSTMLEQGYWYGNHFDYLKEWENEMQTHKDHPIYECNYEESKKDLVGQVARLDAFLGTGRGHALHADIARTCTLRNMPNTRTQSKEAFTDTWLWKEGKGPEAFYRKGEVGDWKNWFTVAQNEQFDQVYASKMADSQLSFSYE